MPRGEIQPRKARSGQFRSLPSEETRARSEKACNQHDRNAFLEIKNIVQVEILHVRLPDAHDRNSQKAGICGNGLRKRKYQYYRGQCGIVAKEIRQPMPAKDDAKSVTDKHAKYGTCQDDQTERPKQL